MSNIQIKEIILYSKDNKRKKTIEFKTGALNIIYGASQSGRSAIIPIIDYCLGAEINKIPVGVIRDNCSGFAIKLKIDNEELFLARSNDESKSKCISYLKKKKINTKRFKKEQCQKYKLEDLKIHLNDLFGISFLDTDQTIKEDKKNDRPSYRDLVCFNFQSQNIVANPNCLLYKSDIYYHRQKIKKIFNYAIGAQTSEQLRNDYIKEQLSHELTQLFHQQNKEKAYRNQIINNSEFIIYKAMEAGLIPTQKLNLDDQISIENLIKEISKKGISDISYNKEGDELVFKKIQSTISNLDQLNFELRGLKQERDDIKEILGLLDKQNQQLNVKKERLEISRFIRNFCKEPSQVYFPKTNEFYTKPIKYYTERKNKKSEKSDFECVQEMFKVMSKAIEDNKPKIQQFIENGKATIKEIQDESKLQIIVLDHAGDDVWGDIENINHLAEWTSENPLVPKNWIKKY